MSNLEHLMDGETPIVSRSNVDAYRVALAVPEALESADKLIKHLEAFQANKVIGQNAYEEMISTMEGTARFIAACAETLRNGVKPKVCQTCKK